MLAGFLGIIGVGMGSPASTAPDDLGIVVTNNRPPVYTPGDENVVRGVQWYNGRCVPVVVPLTPESIAARKVNPSAPAVEDHAALLQQLGPIDPKLHRPATEAEGKACSAMLKMPWEQ